jgi:transcriptional antiterminator NusG
MFSDPVISGDAPTDAVPPAPPAPEAAAAPPAPEPEPHPAEAPEPAPAAEPEAAAPEAAEVHAAAEEPATAAEEPAADGEAAPAVPAADDPKKWYVVKVQSGREDTIKAAIERRVRIEGLEQYFGQIVVPVEKVITHNRAGKRVTKYSKKFPGYLMCNVEFNDRILYLFRETSGVGDFVGASLTRAPQPMSDREVQAMLASQPEPGEKGKPAKVEVKFHKGDRVRVREGTFAEMEGEVKDIVEPKDAKETVKIKVEVTIWGRPTSIVLEHWQIDPV